MNTQTKMLSGNSGENWLWENTDLSDLYLFIYFFDKNKILDQEQGQLS
jgi:hypothetical protein